MVNEPIILIKKKGGRHGGSHHGGAWKVAYADFVTAMMALFILLWLMNSNRPVQEAIAGYFRDPHGVAEKHGSATGEPRDRFAPKEEDLAKLKQQMLDSLRHLAGFEKLKNQVEITVTTEGLRIEMMEDAKGTFFKNGRAEPTPVLKNILSVLSVEIGKLPNSISIEGHTDSRPYTDTERYSNWELSADRANIARRLMESDGVRSNQIAQVRGFADRRLRKPDQPQNACNRRISIIVQYLSKPEEQPGWSFNSKIPAAGPVFQPSSVSTEDSGRRARLGRGTGK